MIQTSLVGFIILSHHMPLLYHIFHTKLDGLVANMDHPVEIDDTTCSAMGSLTVNETKSPLHLQSPAHKFELYGWKPDQNLTLDELYLDIVFLITRSTQTDGRQGHMGALIVRPNNQAICIECSDATKDSTTAEATSATVVDEQEFFQNILVKLI